MQQRAGSSPSHLAVPVIGLALLLAWTTPGSAAASIGASGSTQHQAISNSWASSSNTWLASVWSWLVHGVAPRLGTAAAPHQPQARSDDAAPTSSQWALLVAGSSGWWNYRHQADVLHAYQVLRGGGLHPDRIVLMVFDDLAQNPANPIPGRIYNRPGGPDVYAGAVIDYSGSNVNADTVLAVLQGNKSAVAGIGSGKVIASGPDDHVFMFFSDHGSPGVLGMPSGNFLFANDLNAAIRHKHAARGYKEMTLYIEACESGSMFEGLLDPDLNVYATTAANAEESSWGTYCPGMDIPPDVTALDTCLGDLYSVAWMEDTECEDTTVETLKDQFELVKLRTSHNYTYNMGSHVMQYGRVAMQQERVATYLGPRDASACMLPSESEADVSPAGVRSALSTSAAAQWLRSKGAAARGQCPRGARCGPLHAQGHSARVEQRDADLVPMRVRAARAKTPEQRLQAQAELDAEVSRRQQVDMGLEAATARLLTMRGTSQTLMLALGWQHAQVFSTASVGAPGGAENRLAPEPQYVQQLMTSSTLMGRGSGSGRPLVDSWDCLKGMVAAYRHVCSAPAQQQEQDQYAMKHTRLFANLCNAGVQPTELAQALKLVKGCPQVAPAAHADGAATNTLSI